MENNEHNELDGFFKRRLENAGDEAQTWNTPPDTLFEGALDQMEADENKKKRGMWFWSLGILGALVLGGFVVWSSFKIVNLSSKIEAVEKKNASLEANRQDQFTQNHPEIIDSNPDLFNENKSTNNPPLTEVDKVKKDAFPSIAKGNETSTTPAEKVNFNPFHQSENLTPLLSQLDLEKKKLNTLLDLSSVLSIPAFVDWNNELEDPDVKEISHERKHEKHLGVFVNIGPKFSSLSMTAPGGLSDQLTKYDKHYTGFNVGVGGRKQINGRLNIETSLNYQSLKNQSTFKASHVYEKRGEYQSSNGEMMYAAPISIESPIGLYEEDFVMAIEGLSIQDKKKLTQTTDITSDFSILNLDIGLSYSIIQNTKWNLHVQTGLGANYIFQSKDQLQSKMYIDGAMIDENIFSNVSLDKVTPLFVSASLTLGLDRRFANGLFIGGQLGRDRSINSIRKVDPTTGVKTFIRSWGSFFVIGMSL